MLEILASVQPCTRGTFADLEEVVFRQISMVSGCVCIFLKWDEKRKCLVEQVSTLGVPLLVLVLKGPREKDPDVQIDRASEVRVVVIETDKVQEALSRI
jgi:hypothetical protein